MTFKEMPRVGGGHGYPHKIHPRFHRIKPQTADQIFKGVMKEKKFLGYGWGYIGRGLKGGFKP